MATDGFDDLLDDPRVTWTEDVLRFADTDANGHINNSTYSVLFESGRLHLFRTRIVPTLTPGLFFVIVRLVAEFKAELFYPGTARTGTWVSRLGRTSIIVEQAVMSEGRLAATAEGVCVLMDHATRRPTPFPDEARRVAQSLLRASSG